MAAYAQLARLPRPRLAPGRRGRLGARVVAALETRLEVRVEPGPPLTVAADGDQLDQLLINLVRNAVDAALETGGGGAGRLADRRRRGRSDRGRRGPRPAGPGATCSCRSSRPRPNGTGIGLVLSRQIAEAHGGVLVLESRRGARGARACLRLPSGRCSRPPIPRTPCSFDASTTTSSRRPATSSVVRPPATPSWWTQPPHRALSSGGRGRGPPHHPRDRDPHPRRLRLRRAGAGAPGRRPAVAVRRGRRRLALPLRGGGRRHAAARRDRFRVGRRRAERRCTRRDTRPST